MPKIQVTDWSDTLSDFSPLPAGPYKVLIAGSEQKDDKIIIDFLITDGKYQGRTLKSFLNMGSEESIRMASRTWASICAAAGERSEQTEKLHGKKMVVEVSVNDGKEGKKFNNIKKYISMADYSPELNATPKENEDVSFDYGKQKMKQESVVSAAPWEL